MRTRDEAVGSILRSAGDFPGLGIDRARATELGEEIAALHDACARAARRFPAADADGFAAEFLRGAAVPAVARAPRATDDEPTEAAAIAEGRVASEAATSSALARIAALDPALRCFVRIDADEALSRARERDRERAAGRVRGLLHGVPVAVKDLFEQEGRVTTLGSVVRGNVPGRRTATVLRRLEASGAVCVGTLNLDEFAAGGTGDNPHHGRCRNPWDPARITGGSSSGTAAAVAAGLVPIAIGSDTGGSIRLPAAFCGVTALKPGWGRVSRAAVLERADAFDSIGPAAPAAVDCRRSFACIAGPDPDDPATLAMPPLEPQDADAVAGLRLGVALEPFAADCDPRVLAAVRQAVDALCGLGMRPVPVDLPDLDLMTALHQVVVKTCAARLHRETLRSMPERVSLAARSAIEAGLFLDPALARQALSLRAGSLRAFRDAVFSRADLLVLPVVGQVAPRHDALDGAQAASIQRFFSRSATALRFVNWLGLPALSLPCAPVAGLPTGLQLVGPPLSEARLLAVGEAMQRTTPWHRARPADPLQVEHQPRPAAP